MAQDSTILLCIEDDREVAKLVAEEMSDRGFDVLIAHDGHEGLVAILKGIPDLVLCDIGLPGLSGIELLEHLNELSPRRMPFILVTALCDRENKLRAKQLGIDTKPIDFDALETIIRARLADIASNDNCLRLANLTDWEAELLTWAARGKSSTQIAKLLGAVEKTVRLGLDHARFKLSASREPLPRRVDLPNEGDAANINPKAARLTESHSFSVTDASSERPNH
jgi:DNA-binding response OmpR family regulator